jgi:hypothetical protein
MRGTTFVAVIVRIREVGRNMDTLHLAVSMANT